MAALISRPGLNHIWYFEVALSILKIFYSQRTALQNLSLIFIFDESHSLIKVILIRQKLIGLRDMILDLFVFLSTFITP